MPPNGFDQLRNETFRRHLFEITISERIAQVLAHAQNDDVLLKMTATEQRRSALAHPLYPTKAASDRFATLSTLGSERLTGALLDRLTHHVHILEMNGERYRLNESKARKAGRKT